MASLLDLANRLEKVATKLDETASDAAVKVASEILKDLLNVTPVDTSKALSNWQIGLGSPPDARLKPYFPGLGGSTQEASANAALKAGLDVLKGKKAGVTIYITNNLPYIRRLNDGYSKQAPAGFVERAVLIGRKKAEIKIK